MVRSRSSQRSPSGCGSPTTVPRALTAGLVDAKPWVCPETRFSAPVVEGPKVVENELSLMVKACA